MVRNTVCNGFLDEGARLAILRKVPIPLRRKLFSSPSLSIHSLVSLWAYNIYSRKNRGLGKEKLSS